MGKTFASLTLFLGAFFAVGICQQASALDLESVLPKDLRHTLAVIAEPAPDDGRYVFVIADQECLDRYTELTKVGKTGDRRLTPATDIANHLINAIREVGEYNARGVKIPRFDASQTVRSFYLEFGQGFIETHSVSYSQYSETELTVYSDGPSHFCIEEALIH